MNIKTNRNAIDFLKFVFAILIVLFHSRMMTDYQENWIAINGRIGVEFFFIVSGLLMCASSNRSAESNIGLDTGIFMWRKICRLMPNVVIAYFISFVVYHYNAGITDYSKIILNAVKSIPDIFLIKNSGIRFPSYNGPTWYLSSMLLNMLVLYPILRKLKDGFYIFALWFMLFVLGYFFQTFGTLSDLESWNGYILKGTLRGTVGLLAGAICYKASNYLSMNNYTKFGRAILMLFEWSCYIIAVVLSCTYAPSRLDYFIFLLFMIGITITYSNVTFDDKIFHSSFFHWLGTFSFSLYLGHSCWREFTYNIYPIEWGFRQRLICYIITAIWSGLLVHYTSDFLRTLYNIKKPIIKKWFIVSEKL